ncbi:MAG: myo-inosose-2 dehydratase [Campylobacteraceae bacterium]|nr:myo-inosose-2 dehydratase [Campylobacteraceae bacterium]
MKVKLAKAPIAWSNDDLPQLGGDTPLETCLSEIRQAGYVGTEMGGKFPSDKVELKKVLNEFNLELAGAWFSGNLLIDSVEDEIKRLDTFIDDKLYAGCKTIVYCECSNTIQGKQDIPLSQKPVLNEDEMKTYAQNYNKLYDFAKQKGAVLSYHHHMGTIIQNTDEIDMFLKYTKDEVGLAFDTGHVYFAGGDPLVEIKKHKNRISHIHFKDVRENEKMDAINSDKSFIDAVLAGVYTVPGDGVIDFAPIVDVLKEIDYHGWIVVEAEQDPKIANPLEYATKAYSYITKII